MVDSKKSVATWTCLCVAVVTGDIDDIVLDDDSGVNAELQCTKARSSGRSFVEFLLMVCLLRVPPCETM